MISVGLRVSCVIGVTVWSWGRRELEAPFNIARMANTSVWKRVALSIVRHAGDVGTTSGAFLVHGGEVRSLCLHAAATIYGYSDLEAGARDQTSRGGVAPAVLFHIRVRLRPLYCKYAFGCALRERNASIGRCSIWRAVGGTL
jgi:hypothetical protein